MSEVVRFRISAHSSSGLLCKIVGLFAQLDLAAPALRVSVAGASMDIEASLADFGDPLATVLARKMAGFVGVESVTVVGAGAPVPCG